jgi:hypothetical protein
LSPSLLDQGRKVAEAAAPYEQAALFDDLKG